MKTLRLVIIATGLCLFLTNTINAQVKIGDNPLQISDNRLLEIESGGEFFLVKDSSGMTLGRADALNDPLMIKLFGYGESPSLFAPGGANGNQDYFLGTNSNGEVLEFPLSLDLNNSFDVGLLSLNNGDILFGEVQLDSVFATNTQLSDSISELRTLVAESESSDGDTITGNEWISTLELLGGNSTILTVTENLSGIGSQNVKTIDLDLIFTTDIQLEDTLVVVRNELADTAALLRMYNFYLNNNTFDDPVRTASGGGVTNLSFDDMSEFNVTNTPIINLNSTSGDVILTSDNANVDVNASNGDVTLDGINTTITTTADATINATGDVDIDGTEITIDGTNATITTSSDATINATGDVDIDGTNITVDGTNATITTSSDATINATGDVDIDGDLVTIDGASNVNMTAIDTISIDAGDNVSIDGNVQLDDYGIGNFGSETYLLGVDTFGNVVDVDITTIGGNATLDGPVDLDENGTTEITVQEAIDALAAEIDSNIYIYDGDLTSNRTLNGQTFDLTFDDLTNFNLTNTGTLNVDATTADFDGTTYTADYSTSTISTTGANTINSSESIFLNATDTINADATEVEIDASNNVNITATNNTLVTTDGFGLTATSAISMDGDNSLLRTTNQNEITSTSGNVVVNAAVEANVNGANINVIATDTVSINAGDNVSIDGNVQLDDYGIGNFGSETYLLGVDTFGNVVDVDITTIGGNATLDGPVDLDENGTTEITVQEAIDALAAEIDSNIYIYDGVLTSERTMEMSSFGLTFEGDSGDETKNVYITNDGRMAIGRNSVTAATMAGREIKLDVNGDILAVQVHSSSDKRFKKDIKNIDSAIDKVMNMRGVTYNFRTGEFLNRNFPKESQIGFIAQEVETVIPEVVKTDGEGYKSVDYAKITALLSEAIKEQQKIIVDQQKQIDGQNTLISKMASNTNDLQSQILEIKRIMMNESLRLKDSE